jgi:hypothetical protein
MATRKKKTTDPALKITVPILATPDEIIVDHSKTGSYEVLIAEDGQNLRLDIRFPKHQHPDLARTLKACRSSLPLDMLVSALLICGDRRMAHIRDIQATALRLLREGSPEDVRYRQNELKTLMDSGMAEMSAQTDPAMQITATVVDDAPALGTKDLRAKARELAVPVTAPYDVPTPPRDAPESGPTPDAHQVKDPAPKPTPTPTPSATPVESVPASGTSPTVSPSANIERLRRNLRKNPELEKMIYGHKDRS